MNLSKRPIERNSTMQQIPQHYDTVDVTVTQHKRRASNTTQLYLTIDVTVTVTQHNRFEHKTTIPIP